MRNEIREQIVAKLADKEYRDIFVSEQINTGLAFQLRTMREARGWTQSELGEKTGMAQSRISIMEDANYSRFSINTLKRLASVFDVALIVRFEPYSSLVDHFADLDSSSLNAASFTDDTFFREMIPFGDFSFVNTEYSVIGGFAATQKTKDHLSQSMAGWQPAKPWMSFTSWYDIRANNVEMFYPLHPEQSPIYELFSPPPAKTESIAAD